MDFPHNQFGYPSADSYGVNVDLALVRSNYTTKWRRQRRSYTHNASLLQLSFRLSRARSQQLVHWLQDNDDWFNMELLSGNDTAQSCALYSTEVRRTSTVSCQRVPLQDAFLVAFEVESNSMPQADSLRSAAAQQPALTYPANLPLPQADGFAGEHDDRNVTTYTLTYEMNTFLLKQWQAFAGYAGTAWFQHPMISVNTACSYEVLRYTSAFDMTLVSPDKWRVTVEAEGYPNRGYLPEFAAAPVEEGSYDYPIEYDDATHSYDGADGGVIPPQGNFTMPAGTVVVARAVTGVAPLTGTASIIVYRNGTIDCNPAGVPAWASWHTDADTLLAPALTINATVEVSTNGTVWTTNVPGTRYDLKNQDVYMRLVHTASASESRAVSVPLQFDDGTSTYAVASATAQLSVALTVTVPGSGVVNGFVWADSITAEARLVAVGVQVRPDGTCVASADGASTGDWFSPILADAGAGKWLEVVQTGGSHTVNNIGIRQELSSSRTFSIVVRNQDYAPSEYGNFEGTCSIYSAQSGGSLLGSGTMNISATATYSGIPP